jgi:hypothetical protein
MEAALAFNVSSDELGLKEDKGHKLAKKRLLAYTH